MDAIIFRCLAPNPHLLKECGWQRFRGARGGLKIFGEKRHNFSFHIPTAFYKKENYVRAGAQTFPSVYRTFSLQAARKIHNALETILITTRGSWITNKLIKYAVKTHGHDFVVAA